MIDKQTINKMIDDKLSNDSRRSVDDDKSLRYIIAKLGSNPSQDTIINKINEIINEFNKTLIDNRI